MTFTKSPTELKIADFELSLLHQSHVRQPPQGARPNDTHAPFVRPQRRTHIHSFHNDGPLEYRQVLPVSSRGHDLVCDARLCISDSVLAVLDSCAYLLLLFDVVCFVWGYFKYPFEDRGSADTCSVDGCKGLCYAYESFDWMGVGDPWNGASK
jgi:hypothetical protein